MRVRTFLTSVALGASLFVSQAWAGNPCYCGTPVTVTAPTPAPATAQAPAGNNRAYSYQPGAAAPQANGAVVAPPIASSNVQRRYRSYSYVPSAGMGYRGAYSRGYSFGVRDAGSKARSDYTPYRGGNYVQ